MAIFFFFLSHGLLFRIPRQFSFGVMGYFFGFLGNVFKSRGLFVWTLGIFFKNHGLFFWTPRGPAGRILGSQPDPSPTDPGIRYVARALAAIKQAPKRSHSKSIET